MTPRRLCIVVATALVLACTTDTTVGPEGVTSIAIFPDSTLVSVGDTIRLTAVATDNRGIQFIGLPTDWSSGNAAVATVSGTGAVAGVSSGTAVITAGSQGFTATARVTVTPPPLIVTSADTVTFTGLANGPAPAVQTVVITDGSSSALDGISDTITYGPGATDWLTTAHSASVAPDTLTLTVGSTAFSAGGYGASVLVRADRASNSPKTVVVRLVLNADAPTQVAADSGDAQSATVNTTVPVRPTVIVHDQFGNPVPGVPVTFAAASGGGTVTGASDVTDSTGRARVGSWRLGTKVGSDTLVGIAAPLPGSPVTFTASATVGPAASFVPVSAASPSDSIGASFVDSVRLTDAFDNPIPGTTVTWTAGGPGSLTPGSSATDSSGIATATRSLGTVPGVATDTATAATLAGSPVRFNVTTTSGQATTIAGVAGDNQSDTVGHTLAVAYSVKVTDRVANPVALVSVSWGVTGGGSVSAPATSTNSSGGASVTRTLGNTAGPQGATATAPGLAPVSFTATATHDKPTQIAVNAGNNQSATVGTAVPTPPSAIVRDQFANPVGGVPVTFATSTRSGSITGANQSTTVGGIATVGSWTLGGTAGPDTLTATSTGLTGSPVLFFATGNSGMATTMALSAGNNQTDTVRATLGIQYAVLVTDASSNPVPGQTVSWVVTAGGGSITLTSQTDPSGIARATRVLGDTAGTQTAMASVGGLAGSPVPFTATANHGNPAQIVKRAGDGQSDTVNTPVTIPPSVIVKDAYGNPTSAVALTFAPSSPASGKVTGGSQVSDVAGVAAVTSWTLDSIVGNGNDTLLVTSSAPTLTGVTARFVATALPGPVNAGRSTVTSGTASITACSTGCVAGTTASIITVTVRDAFGNGIGSKTVTPSCAVGTSCVFSPTNGATIASGVFASTFRSTKAEGKTVQAAVTGSGTLTQTAPVTVTADLTQLLSSSTVVATSPIVASSGASLSTVTVTVRDQFANGVSGRTVTLFVSGSSNGVNPPGLTNTSGVTTGSFSSTKAETKTVSANVSGSGTLTATAAVTVNAATASQLVMVTQPAGATSNVVFTTQPQVRLQDAFNNNVLQSGVPVTASKNTGTGTLSGTTGVSTDASGIASWSTLMIVGMLTGYANHSLTFASSVPTPATSVTFNVLVSHSYNIQSGIYTPSCNGCHSWTYANTVNQASSCASTPTLIVPNNTAASHLWRKVNGTQLCLGVMPTSGVNATFSDIIGRWINQGAPNN